MVTRAWILGLAMSLLATTAQAAEPTRAADDVGSESTVEDAAVVHHAPILVAEEETELTLSIDVEGEIESAHLVYRREGESLSHRSFVDESASRWTATLPPEIVTSPGLSYTIEILERVDGVERRRAVFASRRHLHQVQVAEPMSDIVERRLLERVEGRRHELTASGEWVDFGAAEIVTQTPGTGVARRSSADDHYWRVEARYDCRFLLALYSLGLRVGVLRGTSPIQERDPTADDPDEVGLNYAVPELRLRFHDVFHMDAGVIIGVNDEGFAFGGTGAMHIGDLDGPRLTLGFEGGQQLGVTARTQVHLPFVDWLELASSIELTNLPAGDRFGLRMVGDVVIRPGAGVSIRGRGGYQTRFSHGGGPTIGGGLGLAF